MKALRQLFFASLLCGTVLASTAGSDKLDGDSRVALTEVSGTVVDAATRRPISGAQAQTAASMMFSGGSDYPLPVTTTDSRGAFTLRIYHLKEDVAPEEPETVVVTAAGFATVRLYVKRSPVAVALERAVPIVGVVVDDAGKPVAGAWVLVQSSIEVQLDADPHWRFQGDYLETDTRGRFRTEQLPAGPYSLFVKEKGFATKKSTEFGATSRSPRLVLERD